MLETPLMLQTSGNSLGKGYDYYNEGRVKNLQKIDETHYTALVVGSDTIYNVEVDIEKPKKSICNCPYCKGHQLRICKHKVAVILAASPRDLKALKKAYDDYENRYDRYEKELRKQHNKIKKEVIETVNKMSIEQLRKEVIEHRLDYEYDYIDEKLKYEFDIDD